MTLSVSCSSSRLISSKEEDLGYIELKDNRHHVFQEEDPDRRVDDVENRPKTASSEKAHIVVIIDPPNPPFDV